ncbi:MAG: hypothetical protein Q4D57_06540, partial [Clostridia bacterium]|nr:hypothetical protein [Clostridia bacterium]
MSDVKLLKRFTSATEIREAMKLALSSTKILVQKGMEGYDEKTYNAKDGFPNLLMNYLWPGTRDYNMVLIFFAILNYAASRSSSVSEGKDAFKNELKSNVSKGSNNNILRCLVNPSQSNNKMKYTVDTQKLVTELGKQDSIFKKAIDEIYSKWNYNSKKKDQPLSAEEKAKKINNLITKITERMKKITNWIINGPDVARAYVFVCEKWGANIDEDILNLIEKEVDKNGGETPRSQPGGGDDDHT